MEIADAQNARNACHFRPKNMVTGSIQTPDFAKDAVFRIAAEAIGQHEKTMDTSEMTRSARRKISRVR